VARLGERQSRQVVGVSAAARRRLIAYAWPGNVRELANILERAVALCDHETLLPEDLDFPSGESGIDALLSESARSSIPLADLERLYVRRVLESHGGNKSSAAKVLGIDRRTLYRRLNGSPENERED